MRGNASFFAKGVAKEVLRPGKSFLANSVFEAVAFLRTSQATDVPDLQLHLLPWSYVSPNQDEPIRHDVDPRTSLTVLSTLIYPRSRGTLRLASRRPDRGAADRLPVPRRARRPRGARRGLGDGPRDHGRRGVRRRGQGARSTRAPSLKGQELRDAILNRATSVYHGVGTCRMGVDELAVVGPDLKVRGIEGLRVCDASIMPSITGGNTNAPAIMIGERGADLVLGLRG